MAEWTEYGVLLAANTVAAAASLTAAASYALTRRRGRIVARQIHTAPAEQPGRAIVHIGEWLVVPLSQVGDDLAVAHETTSREAT